MTRIIFHLFLLVLPFILYWFYLKYAEKTGKQKKPYPIIPLLVVGGLLTVGSFFVFGSHHSSDPGGTYKPATYKDGKIVPGEIK